MSFWFFTLAVASQDPQPAAAGQSSKLLETPHFHFPALPFPLIVDAELANERGLGYHFPVLGIGATAEIPIGQRFEAQTFVLVESARKYITGDGHAFYAGARGIWWVTSRFGITAEDERTFQWTSQFKKENWFPSGGVVIRDRGWGMPGRLYISYFHEGGCVWATAMNPCQIQSNR